MISAGETVSGIQGVPYMTFEELFSYLQTAAAGFDGDGSELTVNEESLLQQVIAEADSDLPDIFTPSEVADAEGRVDEYVEAMNSLTNALNYDDKSRNLQVKISDENSYARYKERYAPIVGRLKTAVSNFVNKDTEIRARVSINTDACNLDTTAEPHFAVVGSSMSVVSLGGSVLPVIDDTNLFDASLTQLAQKIFDELPYGEQSRLVTESNPDEIRFSIEAGRPNKLLLKAFVLGGGYLYQLGEIEVGDDILLPIVREEACPAHDNAEPSFLERLLGPLLHDQAPEGPAHEPPGTDKQRLNPGDKITPT